MCESLVGAGINMQQPRNRENKRNVSSQIKTFLSHQYQLKEMHICITECAHVSFESFASCQL